MTQTLLAPPPPPQVAKPAARQSRLDRFFDITKRGSSVGREVRGGLTTFVAMAYIVLLNPLILAGAADVTGAKLSFVQLTTMTALSACVTTVLMGIVGRVPLAVAAGLGVNAVVAYQIAPHVTWAQAMGLVVLEGIAIILLAVSGVREAIMNAIPMPLKHAIGVGIGMFIALIGLVDAGFVSRIPDAAGTVVPVTLGAGGRLAGWPILVFAVGVIVMIALYSRKVPGAILISIVAATGLAMAIETVVHPEGWGLITPKLPSSPLALPDFTLFGQIDLFGAFGKISALTLGVFLFTLVLSGFFDAMGTILGVSNDAGLVDKNGKMPGMGRVLMVDGVGAAFGGVTSSSANTVFVESAAGVGEGARTGLSSVVTGGMFGALMFMAPLAAVVPQQAAAPALVLVGALMASQARHIDWSDLEFSIPAFLTIALMPFTYSITNGVGAGVIAYTIIKAARGKWREPGILMWLVSLIFAGYFGINGIQALVG
ncbi:MAG TPA: MFS transporter [Micromonosporaceae bacterium]|nr:MFS transporter [Micromonosporaceae bacterium]